jgi:hypothetical protein
MKPNWLGCALRLASETESMLSTPPFAGTFGDQVYRANTNLVRHSVSIECFKKPSNFSIF